MVVLLHADPERTPRPDATLARSVAGRHTTVGRKKMRSAFSSLAANIFFLSMDVSKEEGKE